MKKQSALWWLLGYCIIEIPLSYCEIFMNLCMRYGFVYNDLTRFENEKRVRVALPSYNAKKVLSACKVYGIRARIYSRHGLFVHLLKYRGRWGILAGLFLSLALFTLSQSVLWRINVSGNERLSKDEVLDALGDCGLYVGMALKDINADSVEQKIAIQSDDISWLSVNMSGTVANVELREVLDTEIRETEMKPANIVAKLDGEIVDLEIYSGFLAVAKGDIVKKGQLLVSGLYDNTNAPFRYTRASGSAFAKVAHSFEVEIPLKQSRKVYSGDKKVQKTLNFFGKSIKLFINSGNLGASCDIMNYEYALDPFSLGELPISVSVDTISPYTYCEIEIDEGEAIDLAYRELYEKIFATLGNAAILKKSLVGELYEDKYILKCNIICICDIAKVVEFEIIE